LTDRLGKEWLLMFRDLNAVRTVLVIVRHVVDLRADWVTAHESSIEGLQQFGDHFHAGRAGVEPQFIALAVEDHRRSVVDS
jgi:hypothetical protein